MAVLENLRNTLADLSMLKTVTAAFGDISALKIQSLRQAFEQNSLFYEQVSQLYHSITLSATIHKYNTDKKKKQPTFKPKTLRVALTSNHRFYGTSNRDVIERFFEESASVDEDRLIIGLTGKDFASAKTGFPAYNIIIFQNDNPPKIEVDTVLSLARPYDRVYIYFPRFVNMLTQKVDRVDIAYSPKDVAGKYQEIKFIFEPELPKIVDFFEQHIRTLLFNRVILETQLARTATRLLAMDTAERNASDLIEDTRSSLRKAKQSLINRRLLETFTIVEKAKYAKTH